MGLVTGIATAFPNRDMRVGFGELHLRIDVAGIANRIHPFFHHPGKIGSVRIVAGVAVSLLERFMSHPKRKVLPGFFVAGVAQRFFLHREQLRKLRCVTGMAGKTSLLLCHGFMLDISFRGLLCVAFKTQLVSRSSQ